MTEEDRIKISCGHQGIEVKDFDGFVVPKHHLDCRRRNHQKRWGNDLNYTIAMGLRGRFNAALKNGQKQVLLYVIWVVQFQNL